MKSTWAKQVKKYCFAGMVAVSGFGFLGDGVAQVEVLLKDDFESYPVGESIYGSNPGDDNPENWVLQFEETSQGVMIREGSSTVPANAAEEAGENKKVAEFFKKDTSIDTFPTFRRNFEPQRGAVQTVFKIRIDDPESATHQVVLGSIVPREIGVAARFRFGPQGFSVYGASTKAGGEPAKIQPVVSDVYVGDWYEVTIFADMLQQTFWASVTNLDNDEPGQSGVSDAFYFWADVRVVNRWAAEQATPGTLGVSFDDIVVERVPPQEKKN